MDNRVPAQAELDPLLSVGDVHRLLGVSTKTVWRLIWRGDLPTVRVGHRVLVEPDALRDFIAARRSP